MDLEVSDARLLNTWRLLATSSGHLCSAPKVDAGTIRFELDTHGRLRYTASARLGHRTRTVRGTVAVKPDTKHPGTWGCWMKWVATSPLHGHLLATRDASVIAAVTPGSMLLNPGMVILVRDDIDAPTAQRLIQLQPHELAMTPTQVRELMWRVTLPGTDSRRFEQAREMKPEARSAAP